MEVICWCQVEPCGAMVPSLTRTVDCAEAEEAASRSASASLFMRAVPSVGEDVVLVRQQIACALPGQHVRQPVLAGIGLVDVERGGLLEQRFVLLLVLRRPGDRLGVG